MRFRTDATDAIRDQSHLFDGPTYNESFEAAQFGDLKIRVGYIALIIEENLDLAVPFKTRDRIY
jgi:hypothetical protein